jgi:hypothetical protein
MGDWFKMEPDIHVSSRWSNGTEDRLSLAASVATIAGLSALSWAMLISAVMSLRAVL